MVDHFFAPSLDTKFNHTGIFVGLPGAFHGGSGPCEWL